MKQLTVSRMLKRQLIKINMRIGRNFSVFSPEEYSKIDRLISTKQSQRLKNELTKLWYLKYNRESITGNISYIVSSLCVGSPISNVSLACRIYECLYSDNTIKLLGCYLDLINESLDEWNMDGGMIVLSKVLALGHTLDVKSTERLLLNAIKTSRFIDIQLILSSQYISNNMIISVAEPLIMFGKMREFSDYLSKYLITQTTVPKPILVAKLMTAIEVARLRRSSTLPDLSNEEVNAVNRIYSIFQQYHCRLTNSDISNSNLALSQQALKQLYNNEEIMFRHIGNDTVFKTHERRGSLSSPVMSPAVVVENWVTCPLLTEDRALSDIQGDTNKRKRAGKHKQEFVLNDITSELCRRDSNAHRLYDSRLFPGHLEHEVDELAEILSMDDDSSGDDVIESVFEAHEDRWMNGQAAAAAAKSGTSRTGYDMDGQYDDDDGEDDDEYYVAVVDDDNDDDDDYDDTDSDDDEDEDDEDDDEEEEYDDDTMSVTTDYGDDRTVSSPRKQRNYDSLQYNDTESRQLRCEMFALGTTSISHSDTSGVRHNDISCELERKFPGYFLQFDDSTFNQPLITRDGLRYASLGLQNTDYRIPYRVYRKGINGIIPTTTAVADNKQQNSSKEKASCKSSDKNLAAVSTVQSAVKSSEGDSLDVELSTSSSTKKEVSSRDDLCWLNREELK